VHFDYSRLFSDDQVEKVVNPKKKCEIWKNCWMKTKQSTMKLSQICRRIELCIYKIYFFSWQFNSYSYFKAMLSVTDHKMWTFCWNHTLVKYGNVVRFDAVVTVFRYVNVITPVFYFSIQSVSLTIIIILLFVYEYILEKIMTLYGLVSNPFACITQDMFKISSQSWSCVRSVLIMNILFYLEFILLLKRVNEMVSEIITHLRNFSACFL
jgi:hypothetical protein